jgi:hypothetical protein
MVKKMNGIPGINGFHKDLQKMKGKKKENVHQANHPVEEEAPLTVVDPLVEVDPVHKQIHPTDMNISVLLDMIIVHRSDAKPSLRDTYLMSISH